MIVVDSSVWIDYFRDVASPETQLLHQMVNQTLVIAGDLVVAEVLQGFASERSFRLAHRTFGLALPLTICDQHIAVRAAQNYRTLRSRGITIRRTIDTLIATRCINDDLPLLYSDRDFDPFVEHLGLRSALDIPGVN